MAFSLGRDSNAVGTDVRKYRSLAVRTGIALRLDTLSFWLTYRDPRCVDGCEMCLREDKMACIPGGDEPSSHEAGEAFRETQLHSDCCGWEMKWKNDGRRSDERIQCGTSRTGFSGRSGD